LASRGLNAGEWSTTVRKSRPPGKELRQFLGAYEASIGELALALRSMVLEETPTANELIYDAYNAVAIGFSFTDRPSEAFCHIAVYSRHVNLGFQHGADLPDPEKRLIGSGKQVRHLKIANPLDLNNPDLRSFLRAAAARAKGSGAATSDTTSPPKSVVRAIYAKRRRPGLSPKGRDPK
jgi:hypothetical protein